VTSQHPDHVKAEHAGPVAKDSLAAESMRAGGDFAKGPNPAGISGSSGSGSTFAADPHGGGKVSTYDGKKPETRVEEALGKPDDDVKRKSGQTGTTGGGKQTQEAVSASSLAGRGAKTEPEHDDSARGSAHSAGSQKSAQADAPKESGRGAHEAPLNTATNPKAFSGLGVKRTGKVGESAEDVDWSAISKDTNPTTNMGSDEDPARLADLGARKAALHPGGDNTGEEGNSFKGLGEESLD
jgi:hypothetical protein